MRKKLLLLCSAALLLICSIKAQDLKVGQAPADRTRHFSSSSSSNDVSIMVNDTAHYFFNKHYFRNIANGSSSSPNTQFYTLSSPYTGTQVITHVGSIFMNTSTLQVNGLEGMVMRKSNSPSLNVPIRLYLCLLNGAMQPILPAVDSVLTNVAPSTAGNWVGGNFSSPVTMTTNFAVLMTNKSTVAGDTLMMFINNASTPTSTAPAAQRYGEGFGRMRYNGIFYTNTNIFGTGTDYEFLTAPRVSFTFTAGIIANNTVVCTNSAGSFSNTSGPSVIDNRQFNFNKFASYFAPWSMTTNSLISLASPDSVYTWNFTGSSTSMTNNRNPSVIFTAPGVQTASLTVRYRYSANGGGYNSITDGTSTNINVSNAAAPSITITGGNAVCAGNSLTLTATGNTTFTWTSPSSNSPSVIVAPTSNTTYSVSASNNGCTSSQTIAVTVSIPPNLNVTGPTNACAGTPFTFVATGANSYLWSTSSTASAITVNTQSTGTLGYTVTGTNAGCPAAVVIKTITVNPAPGVTLTAASNTVCTIATGGSTIALNGSPPGGTYSGVNVIGNMFNTPNSTSTFVALYNYTDSGTGCSKTATTSIVVKTCTLSTVSIGSEALNNLLTVYPNPVASGMLHVSNLEGANIITVYNMLGEIVSSHHCTADSFTLDLTSKAEGNYILRVEDSNGDVKTVKFVNQH